MRFSTIICLSIGFFGCNFSQNSPSCSNPIVGPDTLDISIDRPPSAPFLKKLIWDTLSGTVKIVWSKNSESDLMGYTIHRSKNESSFTSLKIGIIQDTFFIDTLFNQSNRDSLNVLYMIKALDSGFNESPEYSNPLRISVFPPWYYQSHIAFGIWPKKPLKGDSIWIKAACANLFRKNDSIFWAINEMRYSHKMNSDLDSLLYISHSPENVTVVVSVKDNYGYTWSNQISFGISDK